MTITAESDSENRSTFVKVMGKNSVLLFLTHGVRTAALALLVEHYAITGLRLSVSLSHLCLHCVEMV